MPTSSTRRSSKRHSKRRTRRSKRRRSKRRTRRSKRRNEYTAADMSDFTQSLLGQLPNPVYSTGTNIGSGSPTLTENGGLGTDSNSSFSSDGEALVLDPGAQSEIFTQMIQQTPPQPQSSRVSATNNTRARPLSRPRSRPRSRSRGRENKHGHYSGSRCKVRTFAEGVALPWGGRVKKNNGHIKTVPKNELIYPYPIYARPHGKKGENRDAAYFRRGLRDVVYYTKYQISKFCNAKRAGQCSDVKYTYRRNNAQREGRRPVRTKRITKGCEYYTPTERGSISGPNRQSYSDRKYHKRSRSRSRRRRRSST